MELRSLESRPNPPQAAVSPRRLYFFKEKTTFWYLFVAAAVSWILIRLHLVTTGHLFPEGAIFKDFKVKTHTSLKSLA